MTSAETNANEAPAGIPKEASPVACFSVLTEADPSAVPRVLEIFALRDLIPSQIHVTRSGGDNLRAPEAELTIDVQVSGVGRDASEAIARKLRAIICVHSVLTSERQPHSSF
jgi:hypothetical protein